MKLFLFLVFAGLLQSCNPTFKADESSTASVGQNNASASAPRSFVSTEIAAPVAAPTPAPAPAPASAPVSSPNPVASPAPASVTAPSAATPAARSCEDHIQDIGSNNFTSSMGLILSATPNGFFLGFETRTYERTQPMFSERFDPVAAGYSIRFRDSKNNVAVPASAFVPAPGVTQGSGVVSANYGNQVRSRVTFHIARNAALENFNAATADLYCNGRLVGSGFYYVQAFTNPAKDPDLCKHRAGEVINGYCHFAYSCLTLDKATSEIHGDAISGYPTCFNAVPVLHQDCVNGYGTERGYVASCKLLNLQEAPSVAAVPSTMSTIFQLYRDLRKRNPDIEGYHYWKSEIDRDPARLQVLESMLRN